MTGRPTTFNNDILEEAEHYVEHYDTFGDAIPSVVGLCIAINRSRSTVYGWCEDKSHPFSDILDKINAKQQQVLLNKGLTSEFNSNITKLVLGKHGYHDKVDQDTKAYVFVNEKGDDRL